MRRYLIDMQFGVIVDVEASRVVRQAEVGAARTMLERTEDPAGSAVQMARVGIVVMVNRMKS